MVHFFFTLMESCKRECKVYPFMLNAAIPKYAHTLHFLFKRLHNAWITKLLPEPPKQSLSLIVVPCR